MNDDPGRPKGLLFVVSLPAKALLLFAVCLVCMVADTLTGIAGDGD